MNRRLDEVEAAVRDIMDEVSPGHLVMAVALDLAGLTPDARKARLVQMRQTVERAREVLTAQLAEAEAVEGPCDCPTCTMRRAVEEQAFTAMFAGPNVGQA